MDRRAFLSSTVGLATLAHSPQLLAASPGRCPDIDAAIAAMDPESVVVLSGPVGSGKTTAALRAAVRFCRSRGEHVVYIRGPDAPQELAARLSRDDADYLFPISHLIAAVPSKQFPAVMKPPQVWVEDPMWLVEMGDMPFTFNFLDRHSTRPAGLVVVDAFATAPRSLDHVDLPAFSRQSLAPHRAGAILRRIPHLFVLDTMPAAG